MLFKDSLKGMREGAGLTQEGLAQRAGMSVGNVRNYEQGIRLPTFPAVVRLAAALGTTCAAFAGCDDVGGPAGDPGATAPVPTPTSGQNPDPASARAIYDKVTPLLDELRHWGNTSKWTQAPGELLKIAELIERAFPPDAKPPGKAKRAAGKKK